MVDVWPVNREKEMLPGGMINSSLQEILALGKTGSLRIPGTDEHYADKAGG